MKKSRLRELDFLRAIGLILVLLRHQEFTEFTSEMGWIGLDLFFVLSGFLISGLLFREYIKFGNIKPFNFLIRRGYKVYPIYYLSFLLYVIPFLYYGNLSMGKLLNELIFIQNYTNGLGYINPASWSMAIEEHFYIGFVLILWICLKKRWIKLTIETNNSLKFGRIETFIFLILILVLLIRCLSNLYIPNLGIRSFTMTHLRIDAIFAGVLVSYFYHFRISYLNKIMNYKFIIFMIILSGVIWTPFINASTSFFAKTLGFTLLYISFSFLLIYFLMTENINYKLNSIFTPYIVNIFSKIGFCSYSIYTFHMFLGRYIVSAIDHSNLPFYNHRINFIITSFLCIVFGMLITYTIEKYFLSIRDRRCPNRIQ